MIYHNLTALGNNTLDFGDIVYFHINGKALKYSIHSNHLSNVNRPDNSEIFSILGISKNGFCNFYYGYINYGGDWPSCGRDDYAALTRLVRALYQEIEKKEIREIPKYYNSVPIVPLEELKIKLNGTFNESVTSKAPEKKENTSSSNIVTKRKSKVKRIIGEEPIKLNNY